MHLDETEVKDSKELAKRRELLTVEQVADLTALSVETLNQWRSQGLHIPYIKLGRAVRYLRRDVERYILECRVDVSARRHQ
jgi:excisionase family DNA binding protein